MLGERAHDAVRRLRIPTLPAMKASTRQHGSFSCASRAIRIKPAAQGTQSWAVRARDGP
jgi:hypothetical protein